MILPIYYEFVCVLAPEAQGWTADVVDAIHLYGNVNASFLYPEICVRLARYKKTLQNLERLEFVMYGGSSIPQWAGDAISQHVPLWPIFGSTEAGISSLESPQIRGEWSYLRINPRMDHVFRPYLDEYCQLVIQRQDALKPWQAIFMNYPDLSEWETGDLFSRHESKSDLWRPVGRLVDLLNFSEGRSFNPVVIEEDLAESPNIELTMICGCKDRQLVLLVMPENCDRRGADEQSVDRIWPAVEHVFKTRSPLWVRAMVTRGSIQVTQPSKPILRTGAKWNINRKRTLALHLGDLEGRFGKLETGLSAKRRLRWYHVII